jgi:type IV fimbrial biogenesis protein FimT
MLGGNNGSARATGWSPTPQSGGFTLIELMVTVSVLAVLLALAWPSFTAVINNNRLAAQSNELVTSLQLANSEAVRRNARITVCPSTDGATCAGAGPWAGWITIIASNNEVLRSATAKAPVQVTSDVDSVTYRGDGLARDAAGALLVANFTVCIPTGQPVENQRVVGVVSGSRISTTSVDGGGACP